MKNSFSTLFLICLVYISTTQGCLTLYQNYYGETGNKVVICKSGNVSATWNDQVSSIVVPPGWWATLYQNYGYGGTSLNISEGVWNASTSWNDQLSSLKIYPGCPVFYTDDGLSGDSFVMCQSGNVPANFNDQVSSIYVPTNWKLTLYQNYGFGGTQLSVSAGNWSAPTQWNDQLSSVKISGGCPVFYSNYGLNGTSFVMCSSGDIPTSFHDQISSVIVPTGC